MKKFLFSLLLVCVNLTAAPGPQFLDVKYAPLHNNLVYPTNLLFLNLGISNSLLSTNLTEFILWARSEASGAVLIVPNGTNDMSVTIINALATTASVQLTDGVYYLTNTLIVPPLATLRGTGNTISETKGTTLRRRFLGTNTTVLLNGRNITASDFKIDGLTIYTNTGAAGLTYSNANYTIGNSIGVFYHAIGVQFVGSYNSGLLNPLVYKATTAGVMIGDASTSQSSSMITVQGGQILGADGWTDDELRGTGTIGIWNRYGAENRFHTDVEYFDHIYLQDAGTANLFDIYTEHVGNSAATNRGVGNITISGTAHDASKRLQLQGTRVNTAYPGRGAGEWLDYMRQDNLMTGLSAVYDMSFTNSFRIQSLLSSDKGIYIPPTATLNSNGFFGPNYIAASYPSAVLNATNLFASTNGVFTCAIWWRPTGTVSAFNNDVISFYDDANNRFAFRFENVGVNYISFAQVANGFAYVAHRGYSRIKTNAWNLLLFTISYESNYVNVYDTTDSAVSLTTIPFTNTLAAVNHVFLPLRNTGTLSIDYGGIIKWDRTITQLEAEYIANSFSLAEAKATINSPFIGGTSRDKFIWPTNTPANGEFLRMNSLSGGIGTLDWESSGVIGGDLISLGTGAGDSFIIRDSAGNMRVSSANGWATLRAGRLQASKTANFNVGVADTSTVFDNTGSSSNITFTLPNAVPGLFTTYCVTDADGITIASQGNDVIRYGTNVTATAGSINSTNQGSSITLFSTDNAQWFATSMVGVWNP